MTFYALDPDRIPWGLPVVWLVTSPLWTRMARGPQRALVRNSDGPS
jgi:hypothetical protein